MDSQANMNKITQALISQIFSNKKYLKLPRRMIHKILFKLEDLLPEDNIIKNYLPFYWYTYGPFSDVIKYNIEIMEKNGILKNYPISGKNILLELKKEVPIPKINGFEESISELILILEDVNPRNYNAIVEEIYRKSAPYSFMVIFRYDFINQFKYYAKRKTSGKLTIDESFGSPIVIDDMEDILYDCEAELLLDPLFKPFNEQFSSFVTSTNMVLDYIRSNHENFLLDKLLVDTSEKIWETFAQGIRILGKGHHKYYNKELENWKKEYNKSLYGFNKSVYSFNSAISKEVKIDRPFSGNLDEKSKKLLSSIINDYF